MESGETYCRWCPLMEKEIQDCPYTECATVSIVGGIVECIDPKVARDYAKLGVLKRVAKKND